MNTDTPRMNMGHVYTIGLLFIAGLMTCEGGDASAAAIFGFLAGVTAVGAQQEAERRKSNDS